MWLPTTFLSLILRNAWCLYFETQWPHVGRVFEFYNLTWGMKRYTYISATEIYCATGRLCFGSRLTITLWGIKCVGIKTWSTFTGGYFTMPMYLHSVCNAYIHYTIHVKMPRNNSTFFDGKRTLFLPGRYKIAAIDHQNLDVWFTCGIWFCSICQLRTIFWQ